MIRELSALKGIGVWTAEMILLFCMQRPDVFSYDDLAHPARRLRMVYHHRKIDRKLFEKVPQAVPAPYCSVASLYLWAAAGGAVPGVEGLCPKRKPQAKGSTRCSHTGENIKSITERVDAMMFTYIISPPLGKFCWQRMKWA